MSIDHDNPPHCPGASAHRVENPSSDSSITTNHQQNSITADAKLKHTAAQVQSAVEKQWMKCMKTEERTKLLRILVKEGLSLNSVEDFMDNQASQKFGKGKFKRDIENINNIMESKLRDCVEFEREAQRDRGRLRSKLGNMIGERSTKYKKFSNKIKEKEKRSGRKMRKRSDMQGISRRRKPDSRYRLN
jgi:hypothetical protein